MLKEVDGCVTWFITHGLMLYTWLCYEDPAVTEMVHRLPLTIHSLLPAYLSLLTSNCSQLIPHLSLLLIPINYQLLTIHALPYSSRYCGMSVCGENDFFMMAGAQ